MEIVNFLAQFWGFSLIIICFAFLINPKNKEHVMALMEDHKSLTVFGLINVMLGVVFVLLYNTWDSSWKVLVTILAWAVVIRGVVCLFSPNTIKKALTMLKTKKDVFSYALVVGVVLGCVLVYLGQNM